MALVSISALSVAEWPQMPGQKDRQKNLQEDYPGGLLKIGAR
jgi:hypothetical protein